VAFGGNFGGIVKRRKAHDFTQAQEKPNEKCFCRTPRFCRLTIEYYRTKATRLNTERFWFIILLDPADITPIHDKK